MRHTFLLFILFCAGCESDQKAEQRHHAYEDGHRDVRFFYIGKMPCVRARAGYHYGLSCDWTKYKAEQ